MRMKLMKNSEIEFKKELNNINNQLMGLIINAKCIMSNIERLNTIYDLDDEVKDVRNQYVNEIDTVNKNADELVEKINQLHEENTTVTRLNEELHEKLILALKGNDGVEKENE